MGAEVDTLAVGGHAWYGTTSTSCVNMFEGYYHYVTSPMSGLTIQIVHIDANGDIECFDCVCPSPTPSVTASVTRTPSVTPTPSSTPITSYEFAIYSLPYGSWTQACGETLTDDSIYLSVSVPQVGYVAYEDAELTIPWHGGFNYWYYVVSEGEGMGLQIDADGNINGSGLCSGEAPSPTPSRSLGASATPSNTPTQTQTPSITPSRSLTPSVTPTKPGATPSMTPTASCTRESGTEPWAFWYMKSGTNFSGSLATLCSIAWPFTGSGYNGVEQDTKNPLAIGNKVYEGFFETSCQLAPDGYYIVNKGTNPSTIVRVVDGIITQLPTCE